jgi:4-aminobutyrate aminotransferase-like enzyme
MDVEPYRRELDHIWNETRGQIACLITEPYLGGGGSFHPPQEYLPMLVGFCQEKGIPFILDEVQSNFGRTGSMYAFETYGIQPDLVVLGKGLGNGVPVNCVVGRRDVLGSLSYGGASDTWSAHPLGCAAALATLDVFESTDVLDHARNVSKIVARGLEKLKKLPIVAAVRGEGMVWGIEIAGIPPHWSSNELAVECVRRCYLGHAEGHAIHLLGPLAGHVLRISPPLTMSIDEAEFWMDVLEHIFVELSRSVTH